MDPENFVYMSTSVLLEITELMNIRKLVLPITVITVL